mgnify:CR=1 FL=1
MDLTVEEDIPKMVMMYFHFQNELDYERNARLYACILRKREEYPDIFASYQEQPSFQSRPFWSEAPDLPVTVILLRYRAPG